MDREEWNWVNPFIPRSTVQKTHFAMHKVPSSSQNYRSSPSAKLLATKVRYFPCPGQASREEYSSFSLNDPQQISAKLVPNIQERNLSSYKFISGECDYCKHISSPVVVSSQSLQYAEPDAGHGW